MVWRLYCLVLLLPFVFSLPGEAEPVLDYEAEETLNVTERDFMMVDIDVDIDVIADSSDVDTEIVSETVDALFPSLYHNEENNRTFIDIEEVEIFR